MNRDEYIIFGRDDIPGWFFLTDAALFDAVDSAQRQAGIIGDLLEIGCYQGKSAVLLGYMRHPGERFVVCDVFDGTTLGPENAAEHEQFYSDLSRRSFEANYRRFHDDLPEIVAAPSATLYEEGLERTFRFIHIDGSHSYDVVRSDLLLAKQLLVPGGVVVFDDIVSMHAPGVAAAVWEGVVNDELIPLIQSRKLYGTWGTPCQVVVPEAFPFVSHEVMGHSMLHVEDSPIDVFQPAPFGGDEDEEPLKVSEKERSMVLLKRRVLEGLRDPLRPKSSDSKGG